MDRSKALRVLLSTPVLVVLIIVGFIPVIGTVWVNCGSACQDLFFIKR